MVYGGCTEEGQTGQNCRTCLARTEVRSAHAKHEFNPRIQANVFRHDSKAATLVILMFVLPEIHT